MAAKHHIPALDALRGMAVLLVLWTHVPPDTLGPGLNQLRQFLQTGYLGVDIFFVLSGFLMRRLLRIFPIYYLTLVVMTLAAPGPELK